MKECTGYTIVVYRIAIEPGGEEDKCPEVPTKSQINEEALEALHESLGLSTAKCVRSSRVLFTDEGCIEFIGEVILNIDLSTLMEMAKDAMSDVTSAGLEAASSHIAYVSAERSDTIRRLICRALNNRLSRFGDRARAWVGLHSLDDLMALCKKSGE